MALDADFDDKVRRRLDPDSRTVDRMISTALRGGRTAGPRGWRPWRVAFAAAALLLCALWVARQPFGPSSRLQPPEVGLALVRAGEVVMIQSASGETLILGPRRAGDARPAGTGFVIVEGDSK